MIGRVTSVISPSLSLSLSLSLSHTHTHTHTHTSLNRSDGVVLTQISELHGVRQVGSGSDSGLDKCLTNIPLPLLSHSLIFCLMIFVYHIRCLSFSLYLRTSGRD